MNKTLVLVTILFGIASLASAQQVVEENGAPSSLGRTVRNLADAMPGNFPVPSVATPQGSVINVSGDFHNSDITLYVANERIDEFKPKVVDLLSRLNLRNSIVRVRRGRRVGTLDMELNIYMEIRGNCSHAIVPLGPIVDYVKGWDLPQPLGVIIEGGKDFNVQFQGKPVSEVKLLWPKDIAVSDLVQFDVERHWYGLACICFLGMFFLGTFVFIGYAVVTQKKAKPTVPDFAPATLVEAQSKYDQRSKQKLSKLVPLLPLSFIGFTAFAKPWMRDSESWFDPSLTKYLEYLPVVVILIFIPLFVRLFLKRKKHPPAESTDQAKPEMDPLKYMPYMAIPMVFLMLFMFVQKNHPKILYSIPAPVVSWSIRIVGFAPLVGFFAYFVISSRRNTLVLRAGDPDYDAAFEMAKQGCVRLRKVVVLKNAKSANAFAHLFGKIGITQGSRDKLSESERRAVIAHELGHIKGMHVPLLLGSSIASIVIAGFAAGYIQHTHLPDGFKLLFSALTEPGILVLLVTVVRAPFQRKAELSADRFALVQIGSFDQVAIALAKIHLLNASPHTRTKFDESIASHPSLTKRLNALRDVANHLGWQVSASQVDDIIANLCIDPA